MLFAASTQPSDVAAQSLPQELLSGHPLSMRHRVEKDIHPKRIAID